MKRIGIALIAVFLSLGSLRADPVLGIAGTIPASGDYGEVLQALDEVGATATSLSLFWDQFDHDGQYSPITDWPSIANDVYPDRGLALALTLSTIDTVEDRRPLDLYDRPWSDPEVIARFIVFLDEVLTRMPDVPLVYLSLGNEVDAYLSGAEWEEFGAFFDAVRAHVRLIHPDLPVGVTMTWPGLRDSAEARALADRGDGWIVTYYPLSPGFEVAPPDAAVAALDEIMALAGDRPVWLAEAGYPSGGCGGSERAQRDFVEELLDRGADHPRLGLVMLTWMHDLNDAQVQSYRQYYGIGGECFAGYLATLGLRTHAGADKPAFTLLRDRAAD